jgi:hypothetical protein
MGLNNREWAVLLWLLIGLAWALSQHSVRSSLRDVGRAALHVKIILPTLAMMAYVGALVRIGWQLNLWTVSLTKDTIIWFVGSGLVLLANIDKAWKEQQFFRRTALRTLELTVFIQFFANLFVLSLPAELLLQPVVLFLVMLSAFTEGERRYRIVKRFVDRLLMLIGLGIASFSLVQLVQHWGHLDKKMGLLEFALPVWLTLGLLPFIYFIALYAAYESSFTRIDFMVKDPAARRRVKLAVITTTYGRIRDLSALRGHYAREVGSAVSLTAARNVIKKFRAARGQQGRAFAEEKVPRSVRL